MVEVAIKAISALKIRDLSKLTLASQMVEFLINLINQGSDRFLYFHHFPLAFPLSGQILREGLWRKTCSFITNPCGL